MTTTLEPLHDPIAAGRAALACAEWEEARERFRQALEVGESAAAWEGLSWASWWLGDAETLAARECAYRAHRAAGDACGAGRMAVWIANDLLDFRGDPATGAGWLERARRLLEEEPPGSEHGWLLILEGCYALEVAGDLEKCARRARAAIVLGRELGVADLEAVGLALEGEALVVGGRVEEGMRRLDEAAGITASEVFEMPVSPVFALCGVIGGCERVGDFPRAVSSCAALRELGVRWRSRYPLGRCRSAYGHVLACRGDWPKAESELTTAVDDLRSARPALAPRALVRLGELRLRQGRIVEARELFEAAAPDGPALVGLGAVALEDGDARGAADAAERILRRLPDAALLDRVAPLELLARARASLGELEEAERAGEALHEIAAGLRTPYLRGRDRLVASELAAARGHDEDARRDAEDAIDLFEETTAPYEAALARLVLAQALFARGREEAGGREAKAAGRAFSQLGAARHVKRAAAIESGTQPAGTGDRARLGELTARECEILRLVAQGLSDSEIAGRLVVSPHTVHRHVANVRVKLRLPSRAAAVAYASRAGLL